MPAPRQSAVAVLLRSLAAGGSTATRAGIGLPRSLRRLRDLELGPTAGRSALAAMLLGALALLAFSSAGQGELVARSYFSFPTWEAGPLHFLTSGLGTARQHAEHRTERPGPGADGRLSDGAACHPDVLDAADRGRDPRPAPDHAAGPADAVDRHLQLPGVRAAGCSAPPEPVHARHLLGASRSDLPLCLLAQPEEPLRPALHGRELSDSACCRCRSPTGP